eukprot:6060761-Heterocapsa_arctica.AAC.1
MTVCHRCQKRKRQAGGKPATTSESIPAFSGRDALARAVACQRSCSMNRLDSAIAGQWPKVAGELRNK